MSRIIDYPKPKAKEAAALMIYEFGKEIAIFTQLTNIEKLAEYQIKSEYEKQILIELNNY